MHLQMNPQMMNNRLPKNAAKNEFHQARMRAALATFEARLTGKSIELLSYDDVVNKLKMTGRATRGIETIPLAAIVGSVGRYNDFTRTFLPLQWSDADRWASVRRAGPVSELPAIEVYKIGESYFVLDGNHRVSIALQENMDYIDAHVTEIRTKVPLSPDDDPAGLIIKAEYAAFLEHMGLDQLRPEVDLTVSLPGQYETLENHIEVHRFLIEMEQGLELTDDEAVCRWYDEAYLPVITAVREQGILRYFPGRTEADFYVWLATHQAQLRNELGWEVEPEAVIKLAAQFEPEPERMMQRISRRIVEVVAPERSRGTLSKQTWLQERMLDRYSQSLFADVLLPLMGTAPERSWTTAITLAEREQARVFGLLVGEETAVFPPDLTERLQAQCQAAGVAVQTSQEVGRIEETICRRAALVDLVVLDATFDRGQVSTILGCCPRPVLVMADQVNTMDRVLLAYDGSMKANEALFIAAYLAEQWGVELVVVTVQESRLLKVSSDHAQRYLTMHEVTATFVEESGNAAQVIGQTAVSHTCDLILLGGYGGSKRGRHPIGKTVEQMLAWGKRPLLVCP